MAKKNEIKESIYSYPMDEGKELLTPEFIEGYKKMLSITNEGYVYGQNTVTQSWPEDISEEAKAKLKQVLGGADIIREKG